ncbi:MAG: putative oxidoreductase [Frankiales bacterium]|nr:putative oxidoreductase [Frankiales bacterium]
MTGACGGVGAATCALLAERGLDVVGIDVLPGADLTVDITDGPATGRALAAHLADRPVVALVNNAAVQVVASLEGHDDATWDRVIDVNVGAAHRLTRQLARSLRTHGGAVVNVSSVHAGASTAGMAAYAASKAALLAYTRVAALELAPEVRVNAVLPGAVRTAMFEAGLERFADDDATRLAAVDRLVSRTPLARVAEPEEIARVIAFLLDNEQSSFVTGTTLVADGGVTARLASE